jgi:hypothetical protein
VAIELELPLASSAFAIAEYIEAMMLVEARSELSAAEVRAFFPAGSQPAQAELELAFAEIDDRSKRLDETYPYARQEGVIERREKEISFVYDFLCILALEAAPYRQQREWRRSDPLFDELVSLAAVRHLGEGANSIVFGWPPRGSTRPTNFVQAVSWVGQQLGIDDARMDRPPDDNDGGVDVIAWKPFKDGRTGFPTYLIQCTVQLDYARKGREVEPHIWLQWLGFGTAPVSGIAIPFAVQRGDDRWLHMDNRSSLILDRSRICELLNGAAESEIRYSTEIKQFIEQELHGPTDRGGKRARVAKPRKQTASAFRSINAR